MLDERKDGSVSTDGDGPTTVCVENVRGRGFIYFIQCNGPDGPIKIGRATDVKKRFHALQSASPYELVLLGHAQFDDAALVEGGLHGMFAKLRIRGEWFRCDVAILEIARDLTTADRHAVAAWESAPRFMPKDP